MPDAQVGARVRPGAQLLVRADELSRRHFHPRAIAGAPLYLAFDREHHGTHSMVGGCRGGSRCLGAHGSGPLVDAEAEDDQRDRETDQHHAGDLRGELVARLAHRRASPHEGSSMANSVRAQFARAGSSSSTSRTAPPARSIAARARYSPSPVPLSGGLVVNRGWKRRGRASGEMPLPWSLMRTSTRSVPRTMRTSTRPLPPLSSTASSAFESRFVTACTSGGAPPSASTGALPGCRAKR